MFWIRKGQPAIFLAPMEGVTDAPMRELMTELPGFTHCVTEFLRISQGPPPVKIFRKHCRELQMQSCTSSGTPVILQLLGGDPDKLAESAWLGVQAGAKGIDLNFGCPAPTVNRHDGGATILLYPDRLESIVRAVRERVPEAIPVSVKIRLGWSDPETVYENALRAAKGGAAWISIHGRTKTQGYMPPAYWKPIGKVRSMLDIPVIANGEIWTLDDFYACQEQSGCEHFMLGRGALANPYLAAEIAKVLGISTKTKMHSDWPTLINRFIEISEPLSDNPTYTLRRVKQWLKYLSLKADFPDFHTVKRWQTLEELKQNLAQLHFPSILHQEN